VGVGGRCSNAVKGKKKKREKEEKGGADERKRGDA
jgi:hypothetical protein